jgi:uncharacterized protein involved in exopolysaccharide biosynthesis
MTMDPFEVLRRFWQQRWFALPAIVIAVVAATLVFAFGPRDYESTSSYAVVSPNTPTDAQILADPSLADLNSNNPYLRSSDPSLVTSVVITQLNAPSTADLLKSKGLGTDFTVEPSVSGSGFIATITGTGATPAQSLATTKELGSMFTSTLREIQTVNGADDRYLYTAILASAPDRATEKISSRLRAVIIVAVLGIILIFGAVSLGSAITARRTRTSGRGRPTPNRPVRRTRIPMTTGHPRS